MSEYQVFHQGHHNLVRLHCLRVWYSCHHQREINYNLYPVWMTIHHLKLSGSFITEQDNYPVSKGIQNGFRKGKSTSWRFPIRARALKTWNAVKSPTESKVHTDTLQMCLC